MKVTSVETFAVSYAMSRPRGPSILSYSRRESLFVRVSTDSGLVGWGETYALAGARSVIEHTLAPLLVGQDPLDLRRLRQLMWAAGRSGFAVGALDIALHDLWGKALGVPVHRLYGGAQRERVTAYASLPGYIDGVHPAEHWVEEAQDLVERGFTALKLRIGRYPPDEEIAAIGKVREALPAGVRLMADANAAYTLPVAIRVGRDLARMGLAWFEEPLSQFGYHGYPELRAKLALALAGGEGLQTRAEFAALLERGAVDIVQPDAAICGGITETLFVADLAALSAVQCIPHCWGGAVMAAATTHIVALLPDPSRLPGFEAPMLEFDVTENPFRTELLAEPLALAADGTVAVPSGPGLGITVDEAVLRRHAAP